MHGVQHHGASKLDLLLQSLMFKCPAFSHSRMTRNKIEQARVQAGLEEHRLQKRLRILNVTKAREDYGYLLQARAGKEYTMPKPARTPPSTPTSSIQDSKRDWERTFIAWKHALKCWAEWWVQHRVAVP